MEQELSPDGIKLEQKEPFTTGHTEEIAQYFENGDLEDHEVRVDFKLPRFFVFLTIFLFVLGIGLIVGGLVMYFIYKEIERCIAFWIIGSFCFIPGAFYFKKLIEV